MGVADSLGTIERGKVADLVLLDANPLRNIRNTRLVAGVVADGQWISNAHQARSPNQDSETRVPERLEQHFLRAFLSVGASFDPSLATRYRQQGP